MCAYLCVRGDVCEEVWKCETVCARVRVCARSCVRVRILTERLHRRGSACSLNL